MPDEKTDMSQRTASDDPQSPRESFSNYLRDERIRQHKTIEDLSHSTGITQDNITALEEGDRRRLPADVFVKGFIRLYTRDLGLDQQKALHLFEQEWGLSSGIPGPMLDESMAHPPSVLSSRLIAGVIFFAILLLAGSFLYNAFGPAFMAQQADREKSEEAELNRQQENIVFQKAQPAPTGQDPASSPPSHDPKKATETAPPSETAPAESPASAAVQTPSAPGDQPPPQATSTLAPPFRIAAQFTEKTWIKIVLDGASETEYIFKPGERHQWEAQKTVGLFIGNTGGLTLAVNDQPVALPAHSGQTIRLNFP